MGTAGTIFFTAESVIAEALFELSQRDGRSLADGLASIMVFRSEWRPGSEVVIWHQGDGLDALSVGMGAATSFQAKTSLGERIELAIEKLDGATIETFRAIVLSEGSRLTDIELIRPKYRGEELNEVQRRAICWIRDNLFDGAWPQTIGLRDDFQKNRLRDLTSLASVLNEKDIHINRETLRQTLISQGLWRPREVRASIKC